MRWTTSILAALCLASCSSSDSRPRLIVAVSVDSGAPITRIAARTLASDGAEIDHDEFTVPAAERVLSFAIEPAGADLPIHLVLEGFDASGAVRVVRSARVRIPEGDTRTLHLALQACCVDAPACLAEQTCIAGDCAPDAISESELLTLRPREELALDASTCAPRDASTDGDASFPIDGGADAGACPAGCQCTQQCNAGCTCSAGCGCALSCEGVSNCRNLSCSGAGTSCGVEGFGASNLDVTCADGATCVIDATDVSNATGLICRDGARCDVDCNGASNCRLQCQTSATCVLRCGSAGNCNLNCEGTLMTCGGGISTCNRGCP